MTVQIGSDENQNELLLGPSLHLQLNWIIIKYVISSDFFALDEKRKAKSDLTELIKEINDQKSRIRRKANKFNFLLSVNMYT